MQLGQTQVVRSHWADRNAMSEGKSYANNALAPHGNTLRDTYTVPANRAAFLTGIALRIRRDTAATASGVVMAWIQVRSVARGTVCSFQVQFNNNTVGVEDSISLGCNVYLNPTDYIDIRTYDLSTGGTCSYLGEFLCTEFDQ